MNKQSFHKMLVSPQTFDEKDFTHLKEITNHFPYFTTARVLQLKALHQMEHFDYSNSLKSTSIYAHDRSKLFKIIHQHEIELAGQENFKIEIESIVEELPLENEILLATEKNPNDEQVDELEISNDTGSAEYLEQLIQQRLNEMNLNVVEDEIQIVEDEISEATQNITSEINLVETEILLETETEIIEIKDDVISIVENENALDDKNISTETTDASATKSFSDWLKVLNKKSESKGESNGEVDLIDEKEKSPIENQKVLIDTFLETQPRIEVKKAEFYSPVNMARKSLVLDDDIISETLADIFEKQGMYDKAENAYKKLSLKFPEKKVFFAARLEKIKALKKSSK